MVKTGKKVAIKTEPGNEDKQKLQHEKEILSQLRGTPGIPKVRFFLLGAVGGGSSPARAMLLPDAGMPQWEKSSDVVEG